MTPEGKVKAQVKKILDSLSAYYIMPVTGGYGRSGIPDFIICYQGRFLAIETKDEPTDQPTALQIKELNKIDKAGGITYVVNNKTDMKQLKLDIAIFCSNRTI
jgi:hypothetical protein